jgi:hypothetical protein
MLKIHFVGTILLAMFLTNCSQNMSKSTSFFKNTKAFELAIAVEKADLKSIENLVCNDSTLLGILNPISSANVLSLSLYLEQFESFKKLLALRAEQEWEKEGESPPSYFGSNFW